MARVIHTPLKKEASAKENHVTALKKPATAEQDLAVKAARAKVLKKIAARNAHHNQIRKEETRLCGELRKKLRDDAMKEADGRAGTLKGRTMVAAMADIEAKKHEIEGLQASVEDYEYQNTELLDRIKDLEMELAEKKNVL